MKTGHIDLAKSYLIREGLKLATSISIMIKKTWKLIYKTKAKHLKNIYQIRLEDQILHR